MPAPDTPLLFRVPDEVDLDRAAFANLMCVALTGLLDVPVHVGDCAVVVGLGVVGTLSAHLARLTAERLIVVDPLERRRELAGWIGADAVVAPVDAADATTELTAGRGADVSIEASGAPAALQSAIDVTGQEGTVAVVSYYGRRIANLQLSPEFHLRRLKLISSQVVSTGSGLQPRWNIERRMDVAMRRMLRLDPTPMISHRLPFSRAPEALRLIDTHPEETLGVLLDYE